jgi:hypothetical protein
VSTDPPNVDRSPSINKPPSVDRFPSINRPPSVDRSPSIIRPPSVDISPSINRPTNFDRSQYIVPIPLAWLRAAGKGVVLPLVARNMYIIINKKF